MSTNLMIIEGNLTNDPELRFTPSGAAVVNFTIASTPRKFNKTTNQYEDEETLFLRASAWRELAENIAESLTKGCAVTANGKLKSRSYETKEGEKRTVIELEIDEIGPSLKRATAQITRTVRTNSADKNTNGAWSPEQPLADPWGQQTPAEPPF